MLGGKGRFTRSLMGLILLDFLAPVQLGKHILELLRDGQTDVSSVLQQRQSLISFLLVNFSRRDSVIIESFDTQYSLSNSSGIQKSAQPTDFSVR